MKRAAIAAALVALVVTVQFGSAQSDIAQLAFVPAASTATVGASVPVDVTIASVAPAPGLGGYDITINFDPAVVRMDSLTDAGLLTGGSNIVICAPAVIDGAAGTATITCSPIPLLGLPGYTTTSPVALLHASFTALAAGTSDLDMAGSTLQSPASAALTVTLANGSITVTAPATATSTPPTRTTPQVTSTREASATPSPAALKATATAALSPTPRAAGTVSASTFQPPSTGSGGGPGGFPLPLALLGVAVALAGAAGLGLAAGRLRAPRA